ncbi:MAG: hypothetical protein EBT07_04570 [Actinobacteria bacterium]|nr:hypothetical protein [Actinomycetota bacterium]
MDYLDWNDSLCRYFFCKTTGGLVFPCVSKNTLADVSKLDATAALSDFTAALKQGPKWTQIPRCQNILSKAHNCLYPDPKWKEREAGEKREKLNLIGHVYWSAYEGGILKYPPYFAYLCLLVLSWTERNDDEHGGNFYDPLNRILERDGDQRIDALGTRYTFNKRENTINDLWQDLQDWSLKEEGPVLDLPPPDEYANDYVYIAQYYGLLKAVDLRKIDCVLFELSKKNLIYKASTPEEITHTVLHTQETQRLFSDDGKEVLNDKNRNAALGRLLLAKYKIWDGSPCEDYIGPFRGFHKLLRVIRDGRFYSLIKLRSVLAIDRANIKDDVEYQIDTETSKVEKRLYTKWPLRSEFSTLFQIVNDNPECSLDVFIPWLGIKAHREKVGKQPLVFCKLTLVHLMGAYVEVDQVEPGRHYLLLENSGNPLPEIRQYLRPDFAANCPDGYDAYTLCVPENVIQQWPDNLLPPLAKDRAGGSPRIKIQSIFAMDKDHYLVGFPISITSTSDNYAPKIVPCDIPHQRNEGALVVTPSHAGNITISLDPSDENVAPIKTNRVISIHQCSADHLDSGKWTKYEHLNVPSYPTDKIRIIGNSFLYSTGENAYYNAGSPITITIEPEISAGDIKRNLRINGKDVKKPFTLENEQVRDGKNVQISLWSGNEIIVFKRIIFRSLPEIHITGVSVDQNRPKVLHKNISFTAIPNKEDKLEAISCSYLNNRQELRLPVKDLNWIDYLTQYGQKSLPHNTIFCVDFILGDVVLKTCWFITPRPPQPRQPTRPVGGFNNLGALLDGLYGKKKHEHP